MFHPTEGFNSSQSAFEVFFEKLQEFYTQEINPERAIHTYRTPRKKVKDVKERYNRTPQIKDAGCHKHQPR